MKKSSENITFLENNSAINKNLLTDKNKTTNVNILLNRVRLGKKKDLRKKIIFLTFLVSVISVIVIFVII
mgnify:CR=1 FL=1